jgi:serine phosphatase RsbU (regulator of sigma subunit)
MLYLCTDGIADQNSPSGEKFGMLRLAGILKSCAPLPFKELKMETKSAIYKHQSSAQQRNNQPNSAII